MAFHNEDNRMLDHALLALRIEVAEVPGTGVVADIEAAVDIVALVGTEVPVELDHV
jgi:hypothetical protein